jgi:cell division protein FtsI (penicillin-binding protein 3)
MKPTKRRTTKRGRAAKARPQGFGLRPHLLLALLAAGLVLLAARAVQLQVVQRAFLQAEGAARFQREAEISAHRGMITDRFGEPLAISTPVASVWADPQELPPDHPKLPALAAALGLDPDHLASTLAQAEGRAFLWLQRRVAPEVAQRVSALALPGVGMRREYRRFYPAGELTGHLIGFTDIDDRGQEGLERAYDSHLAGHPGRERVLQDRLGHVVEALAVVEGAHPGEDLRLALDRRIQYLAYRALQDAVAARRARGGSVVVLDVRSGELLAVVNQPAFNPNAPERRADHYRNRAFTDTFEPGSTAKPFTVAAALRSGDYRPTTPIDTRPGWYRVGRKTIRDLHNYGLIDVATVIQKSSNVGASRIALSLPAADLWRVLHGVGFGRPSGSQFPGEALGHLADPGGWREIEQATLSYGYGLSVTTVQLAQAYATLASGGVRRPVSLLALQGAPEGQRVLSEHTTAQVRRMLERVVQPGGTGTRARVPGYRVAGKTGTVRKAGPGGYTEERFMAVFAGMAPASVPRLAVAVMVDEPQGEEYYGGQVAAPVFAEVMAGALRLLDVAPDAPQDLGRYVALKEAP